MLFNDPDYDVSDFLGDTGSCCMALNLKAGELQEILKKAPETWRLSKPSLCNVKKRPKAVTGWSRLFMTGLGTEQKNQRFVPATTL